MGPEEKTSATAERKRSGKFDIRYVDPVYISFRKEAHSEVVNGSGTRVVSPVFRSIALVLPKLKNPINLEISTWFGSLDSRTPPSLQCYIKPS